MGEVRQATDNKPVETRPESESTALRAPVTQSDSNALRGRQSSDTTNFYSNHQGQGIWDPEKGISKNFPDGIVQDLKPDHTVDTTIPGQEGVVTYDPKTEKYFKKNSATDIQEIGKDKLPKIPPVTQPPGATGDKVTSIIQRTYDGSIYTYTPKPEAGAPFRTRQFPVNDLQDRFETKEFGDPPNASRKETTFDYADTRLSVTELLSDGQKTSVATHYKNPDGSPGYTETYNYVADKFSSQERLFPENKKKGLPEITQILIDTTVVTSFKPALSLPEDLNVSSLTIIGGEVRGATNDKNEAVADLSPKQREQLLKLLSEPIGQRDISDGTTLKLFADWVTRRDKTQTEAEIKAAEAKASAPSEALAQPGMPKKPELEPQTDKPPLPPPPVSVSLDMDFGNGNKGRMTYDGTTSQPKELSYAEGSLAGQTYKFGNDSQNTLNRLEMPNGYALSKNEGGEWQYTKNGEACNEVVQGLGIQPGADGKLPGTFDVSKKGDIRHKSPEGIETVLRSNGNLDSYNMNDYSWTRTGQDGKAETKFWDGFNWRQGEKVGEDAGKSTIKFTDLDPNNPQGSLDKPAAITRFHGAQGDPEAGQLELQYADGHRIRADWSEQTQTTEIPDPNSPDKVSKVIRYFDGTNYREGIVTSEENNKRTVEFQDTDGPKEISYDRNSKELTSIFKDSSGKPISQVKRDSRGYVSEIIGPPNFAFQRDADGDINQATLPDGTIYKRAEAEQIPGEAQKALRARNTASTPATTTNEDPAANAGKFNKWNVIGSDGKVQGTDDANFITAADGTVSFLQKDGNSNITSPTKITESKRAGGASQIVDASGNIYESLNGKNFRVSGSTIPIAGEPIKMGDGSVRFRLENGGEISRNANDQSFSLYAAGSNQELQRNFDNGAMMQYQYDNQNNKLLVASKNSLGQINIFNYGPDGKVAAITDDKKNILAQIDESGKLKEVQDDGSGTKKPTGRIIEINHANGSLSYAKDNSSEVEIKHLDLSVTKINENGQETTLPNKVSIQKNKDGATIGVTDSLGRKYSIQPGADLQKIASVTLPGGETLLDAKAGDINIDPKTGTLFQQQKSGELAVINMDGTVITSKPPVVTSLGIRVGDQVQKAELQFKEGSTTLTSVKTLERTIAAEGADQLSINPISGQIILNKSNSDNTISISNANGSPAQWIWQGKNGAMNLGFNYKHGTDGKPVLESFNFAGNEINASAAKAQLGPNGDMLSFEQTQAGNVLSKYTVYANGNLSITDPKGTRRFNGKGEPIQDLPVAQ